MVCLGFLLPGHLRRRAAAHTVEQLRPLLAVDARFRKVSISCSTLGSTIIGGTVNSGADAIALHHLVEQAHPPQTPSFVVQILTTDIK